MTAEIHHVGEEVRVASAVSLKRTFCMGNIGDSTGKNAVVEYILFYSGPKYLGVWCSKLD